MAASTFVPVSLDPPLVAICVQNTSTTWPRLAQQSRIGISLLGVDHESIVRTMAAKDIDRFTGVETETHCKGALFISGSSLWLDVSVDEQLPAGDHAVALLRVNEIHCRPEAEVPIEPIVFHRSALRKLMTT